jgi:steroid delta-isomerase-like uncharacterized protein
MRFQTIRAAVVFVLAVALGGGDALRSGAQGATPVASPPACPATSPDENKTLVRRYVDEVYNAHDAAAADAFLAEDFNRTNPAHPYRNEPGTADDVARIAESFTDFPDTRATIEDLIAEGDRVVVRLRIDGTQQDDFEDIGAPATGRRASWETVVIWRVAGGELAENWVVSDRLSELRQLGIVTDDELATVGTPTVATPSP